MSYKRDLELYFDMDECIVNLSQEVVRIYNEEHDSNHRWENNDKYWWGDISQNKIYFENLLKREGLFYNSLPVDGMIDTLNDLNRIGYDIYFITMPDYENKTCYYEKLKWLQKHLEWFKPTMLIATESKHLLAKPNRILIDDNAKYLKSFQQEGGISIGIGNHSWTKEFKGLYANNSEELYKLINEIEKGVI